MAASGRIANSASTTRFPHAKWIKGQEQGFADIVRSSFKAVCLHHAHHSVGGQTHESSSARRFHVMSAEIAVAVCVGHATLSSSSQLEDGLE